MNNNSNTFSFTARIRSIRHAIIGIMEMLEEQPNARIHAMATIFVIALGVFFQLQASEWCFLILAIGSVWVAEAFNTALEFLCNIVSPDFHPLVKKSKDAAAGAVLLCAISAVMIGIIIFLPHVKTYI